MAPKKDLLPIDDQAKCPYSNMSYGKHGTIAKNGCGVIAFYNLMVSMGDDCSLPHAIRIMTFYRGPLFGGKGGTKFWLFPTILRGAYRDVHALYYPRDLSEVDTDSVIVLYTQNGWPKHYVAGVRVGSKKYVFYNDGCSAAPMTLVEYAEYLKKQKKRIFQLITLDDLIGL